VVGRYSMGLGLYAGCSCGSQVGVAFLWLYVGCKLYRLGNDCYEETV
jgi:hypothetical protein